MSSKWPNLVYGKPWKTVILRIFQFLKAVIILGCPNLFRGSFKHIFEKFRNVFYFFITSWSFCKRVLNFWSLKPSQNGTILCSMEDSKKIRNFEKISIFEVYSDIRMHKMNSWGGRGKTFLKISKFSTIILDSFRIVWFETLYFSAYLFEVRTWAFWMFCFNIRYFSNILVKNTISFPWFRCK